MQALNINVTPENVNPTAKPLLAKPIYASATNLHVVRAKSQPLNEVASLDQQNYSRLFEAFNDCV